MHAHYFTLKRQAAFLHRTLAGARVVDSFSAHKNEWLLLLELPGGDQATLALGCDPHFPYFVLREPVRRGKNMAPVMETVLGRCIRSIQMEAGERVVTVRFSEAGIELKCRFFGLHTNFFLVDESGTVCDAFKKGRQWIGRRLEIPASGRMDPTRLSLDAFLELASASEATLEELLKRRFLFFNRTVLEEVFCRTGLEPTTPAAGCSQVTLEHLFNQIQALFDQFQKDAACLYFQGERPVRFTLGPFQSLAELSQERIEDLNRALRVFCFQALWWQWFHARQQQLLDAVEKRRRRLEKRLEQMARIGHDASKSERYRQMGELLLSQPQAFRPGAREVVVVDYFRPEMPELRVPVEPGLSLQENAERYFKKARQSARRGQELSEEKSRLREELKFLEEAALALQKAGNRKTLEKWEQALRQRHLLQGSVEERASYRLPYRLFEKEGYQIWVGRSAADNDRMTFGLAHKEDWWLHVQGTKGSHVVIRNPRRLDWPPDSVAHFAARLAVTYSAAKHARYVPVMVTKVKYVRKPRKSPPGTVVAERTRTLFVDPLPD